MKCKGCGSTDIEGGVPQERVDKIAEQRREARDEAKAHLAKLGDLEADLAAAQRDLRQVETLQSRVQELEAASGAWTAERTLMQAGVTDPEGISVATALYNTLPPDDRPELSEWLASDTLPRGVRAYLPTEASPPPAPSEGEPATAVPAASPPAAPSPEEARRLPPSSRGAAPGVPPAVGQFTAEQIRAMSPDEYAQHREAIYAAHLHS